MVLRQLKAEVEQTKDTPVTGELILVGPMQLCAELQPYSSVAILAGITA